MVAMKRDEVLAKIASLLPDARRLYAVRDLAVFGSVARDEAKTTSDIDVLVEFEGKTTFDHFMGLKFYLEDSLGVPIDLVTRKALRRELRQRIEEEAIHVP